VAAVSWSVQYDAAVFPATDPQTITNALEADVTLGTDVENGSATVRLVSLPGGLVEGVRIYIYVSGSLVFNGKLPPGGTSWNSDGTVTLSCVDALHKLRNPWGGADRVYNADTPADTDTSTAQNIVEASGIDASLTSIQGEGRTLGTVQDVVIHGGNIDIDGNPSQQDVMREVLRLIDKSVVPNYATFTRGDGAVYRRGRVIGSSAATFADGVGGSAWDFERRCVPDSIVNKWLVKGLTIAEVPTEGLHYETNALLTVPFYYNAAEFSSYLIDDATWAQDLAEWLVDETNGRLNIVTWTTELNNDEALLGATVTVTSTPRALSSQLVYVTGIRHHISGQTGTTSWTGEFRD
jgi:hypothetical protein